MAINHESSSSAAALEDWPPPRPSGETPARVTLIDRTNHHLFQPLLYQVATAALTPGQIGTPIRGILRNQKNVSGYSWVK